MLRVTQASTRPGIHTSLSDVTAQVLNNSAHCLSDGKDVSEGGVVLHDIPVMRRGPRLCTHLPVQGLTLPVSQCLAGPGAPLPPQLREQVSGLGWGAGRREERIYCPRSNGVTD